VRYVLILAAVLSLLGCTKHDPGTALSSLERLQGQWVVINYWAQWCAPCIKEIPELNRLDQDYAQVTVVGVNYDGTNGHELELQRQKLGVTFASLESDPAAQLGIPRPVVLPTTLILDPTGRLVATLIGPQTLASLVQATQQDLNKASN
jgi:thiol-disulfide isomerase/thioredoxin